MTSRAGWREYAIEAVLLAVFMLSACAFTILAEHPRGPVAGMASPAVRRALVGGAMGVTALALIYSRWGHRSGAHLNPAVTMAFARLRGMGRSEVAGYVVAQFAGGIAGMLAAALLFGSALAHPAINWIATGPGPAGPIPAFAAELLMPLVMLTVVLRLTHQPRLAPYAGLASAALLAVFITLESPVSGTSLNPARTLGPALITQDFGSLWIYFIAPPAGAWLAASFYARTCPRDHCPRGHHPRHSA